jgi:phasin family protein
MDTKGKRANRPPAAIQAATGDSVAAAAPPSVNEAPLPAPVLAIADATAKKAAPAAKDFGEEALAALSEAQGAVARGLEAITVEMTGLARAGIAAATEAATAMLSAKTLPDAIEINAGFARRSLDTLLGSSAALSEIGVRLATESTRPILERFGEGWRIAGAV